jgi:hypothetical protein
MEWFNSQRASVYRITRFSVSPDAPSADPDRTPAAKSGKSDYPGGMPGEVDYHVVLMRLPAKPRRSGVAVLGGTAL